MKRLVSLMITALSIIALVLYEGNAAGAYKGTECTLTTSEDSGSSLYRHSFQGTNYYFTATIKNGEETDETVYIYLPDDRYSLVSLDDKINEEEYVHYETYKEYAVSSEGSYRVQIYSPSENEKCVYAEFSFRISRTDENGNRIVRFEDGSVITTNIPEDENAVMNEKAFINFDDNRMFAIYTYNDGYSQKYTSGEELSRDGRYTIVIGNSVNIEESEEYKAFYFEINKLLSDAEISRNDEQQESNEPVRTENVQPELQYDSERKMYVLKLTNDEYVCMNIDNEGTSSDKVKIEYTSGVAAELYRDGKSIFCGSGSIYSTAGKYSLTVSVDIGNESGTTRKKSEISFEIISEDENGEGDASEEQNSYVSIAEALKELQTNDTQVTAEIDIEQRDGTGRKIAEASESTRDLADKISALSQVTVNDIDKLISQVLLEQEELEGAGLSDSEKFQTNQNYDRESGVFVYNISENAYLTVNVPNGAVVSDDVVVNVYGDMSIEAYKDDKAYNLMSGAYITEHGDYRIEAVNKEDGSTAVIVFYIVKHPLANLTVYNAPKGFMISNIKVNGKNTRAWMSYYKISTDGTYEITVENTKNSDISYNVTLVRDNTPPVISVLNMDSTNTVIVPALVSIIGDAAEYELYRNNKPVSFNGSSIEQTGKYVLTVRDAAGNSSQLEFKVKGEVPTGTIVLIVVLVVLVGGGTAWFIWRRNNLSIS